MLIDFLEKGGEMDSDPTLECLLDMNGMIFGEDDGHWYKFEAWRVEPNEHIPHGIRYSLTLHDRHNRRILGFDNAHSVVPKSKKFGCKKTTWDHKHQKDKIENYEFDSAGKLLEDFWNAVEIER